MYEKDIREEIEKSWEEVRQKLDKKEVKYNDIEGLKQLNFFNRFNDMFTTAGEFAVVKLSEINLLLRSCKGEVKDKYRFRSLKKEDGEKWEKNKHKLGANRYNDPERGFMYFGISMKKKPKQFEFVNETCKKEIRVFDDCEMPIISTLEFKVYDNKMEKKVLDFSKISSYNSCKDIEEEMNSVLEEITKMYTSVILQKNKEIPANVFAKPVCIDIKKVLESPNIKYLNKCFIEQYLVKMYLKLVNDSTFREINKAVLSPDEIKKEYAPFHAFANYIENMGYAGIIYNSTVHKDGLNLVVFNRDDVEFYGDIRIEKRYRV